MMAKQTWIAVVATAVLLAMPASMVAASDPAERTRLLEAENHFLRSQIASMRKEVLAMRQEIARLKARPTATTRPSTRPDRADPTTLPTTRPAKSGVYLAGPVIRGDASIGVLRAFYGRTTGGHSRHDRIGLIVVLEITNRSDGRKFKYSHFRNEKQLTDNLGNSYDSFPGTPIPKIRESPAPMSWLFPGEKNINVVVFDSRLVPKAKTLILTLGKYAFVGNYDIARDKAADAVKFTIPIDCLGKAPDPTKVLPRLPSRKIPRGPIR